MAVYWGKVKREECGRAVGEKADGGANDMTRWKRERKREGFLQKSS